MGGRHLTIEDRRELEKYYLDRISVESIAETLRVHRSTIYNELRRGDTGRVDKNGNCEYSAELAQKRICDARRSIRRTPQMPMFKTCTACKETFIAESPFIKLCPICNAKSQTTPAERAQRKTRITPDRLMLDVRQADAAGKSYGRWRYEETERRRKEEEEERRKFEERQKRRKQMKAAKENEHGESET